MKPAILFVILCLPLISYSQIAFEELTSPDDFSAFVKEVNESGNEHQFALTSDAFYSKYINDTSWVELSVPDVHDAQIQYSPDGDLYISRPNNIWYSEDNGHSISIIPLPTNGFPLDMYFLEVLDDDVIFIIGSLLGDCYYTLNNGQDWTLAGVIRVSWYQKPEVKLIYNSILIVNHELDLVVTKINVATNEITEEDLDIFIGSDYFSPVILDHGTILFHKFDLHNGNSEGLYRYRYGEELVNLGLFDELKFLFLHSAGNNLYAFGHEHYYVFNGIGFTELNYMGLPVSDVKEFMISENDYLYTIVDSNRIFKSTKPLSAPNITGTVRHNDNLDCVFDTLDPGLKNWQVKIESDDFLWIKTTDSGGKFNFTLPEGEYNLSSQPINANWDLCESNFTIGIDKNNMNANQDFLANSSANCAELEIDFSTPLLRRCFDNYYSIRVRNTGPEVSENTILTLELDPFFEFISATISYMLEGNSILRFDLGSLAVNDEISFQVFFKLSCDADLGIEHCLTGYLKDANECGGDRSSYTECQENIGAYDPNDKRIFNETGREAETVDKGEYIYYHIRFQNTGTDTAFNVRVVDPLSPSLDLSTLEMLSASHPYEFVIIDGPNLEVTFKNILLPDSTKNEPASHGFFKFRIKPLAAYGYGTIIPNEASIYFDFNDPVLTNEATLLIMQSVGIKEATELIEFNVFPNPTNHELTLTIFEGDFQRIDSYAIIDQLGHVINHSAILSKVLSVAHLPPGIYNLMLKEDGKSVGMKRFIRL